MSSSTRSALRAMAAFDPAAAAAMTLAAGSVRLPAAHTPETLVRPVSSVRTQLPATLSSVVTASEERTVRGDRVARGSGVQHGDGGVPARSGQY